MTELERAARLFAELALASADPPGVTRDSFGLAETAAHAMIRREANVLRLETWAMPGGARLPKASAPIRGEWRESRQTGRD